MGFFLGLVMSGASERGAIKRAPGDSSPLSLLPSPARSPIASPRRQCNARAPLCPLSLSSTFSDRGAPGLPQRAKVQQALIEPAAGGARSARSSCARSASAREREKREAHASLREREEGGAKRCPNPPPVIFRARALHLRRSNARTFLGCGRMDAPRNGCSRKYSVMTPPAGALGVVVAGLGAKRKAALALLSLSLSRRSPSSASGCCCSLCVCVFLTPCGCAVLLLLLVLMAKERKGFVDGM